MAEWTERLKRELEGIIERDPAMRFSHFVGNALTGAVTYSYLVKEGRQEVREKLTGNKEEFYRRLGIFLGNGFEAKGDFTESKLRRFYDFRDLNWEDKENMDKVWEHYVNISP